MSNNTPDYNDNLVFEPEMTWEEFVSIYDKEKTLYEDMIMVSFADTLLEFCKDGRIKNEEGYVLAYNFSYKQMGQVIKALKG